LSTPVYRCGKIRASEKKGALALELFIRQRVFSLGDKYDVYDERQEPVYHVQGELFSWGAKIHLYDLGGSELFYIRQKLLAFLPEYAVFQGENFCARIKKELSFFHPRLSVESSFGDFEITDNFMDMDYEITRDRIPMGEIHKSG
jgi:uncharacterized protein YxjI